LTGRRFIVERFAATQKSSFGVWLTTAFTRRCGIEMKFNSNLRGPIFGVLVAVAITTTMDASGLSIFSALPLLPLMAAFWWCQRLPRRSMGFVVGRWSDYGLALLYPVAVLGVLALASLAMGVVDTSQAQWGLVWKKIGLVALSTTLAVMLTEEGFFRGWLWASLERASEKGGRTLLWTSLAFALWHVSAVTLNTGFNPPDAQVPLFLVNAAVMGAIWGLLRGISGSVLVASVSHGAWNAGAYVLFGFGAKVGALGIHETSLYGPEVGIFGLILNIIFAFTLWRRWERDLRFRRIAEATQRYAGDSS
jgi:membrane protease YdiL (CAAX protease family)